MARLRSPVSRSERKTCSSTPSSRPAKRPSAARMNSNASPPLALWIRAQPDRVEGVAARFDPDHRLHPLGAEHFQRQRKDEGFGDRLDGEGNGAVADFVDGAVDGGE